MIMDPNRYAEIAAYVARADLAGPGQVPAWIEEQRIIADLWAELTGPAYIRDEVVRGIDQELRDASMDVPNRIYSYVPKSWVADTLSQIMAHVDLYVARVRAAEQSKIRRGEAHAGIDRG
jgi:hypothetical protein